MQLTLNGLSALKVLRQIRKDPSRPLDCLPRVDLCSPEVGTRRRWNHADIAAFLSKHGLVSSFSDECPLHVAVPLAADRLRNKGVRNTVYARGLPHGAFLDLGDGLFVSSPELLFVELSSIMSFEVHLLLGMELCGTFSRDSEKPREGDVVYQVPAATSVKQLRAFVDSCHGVKGVARSRETLEWLQDDAWSPMEAVVAMLAVLPGSMLGYDLWPVDLNRRIETGDSATKRERVPDLVFRGTEVGLNYDGEDHLPLQEIADAAMRVAASPGDESSQIELEEALREARKGVISDKRRDRDLGAAGLTVLAMTKEDLYERGGLDRLMLQVMDAIERTGKRRLNKQRVMMKNALISNLRQELIWSLLPGKTGSEHAAVYSELMRLNPDPERYVISSRYSEGTWTISQKERGFLPTQEVYF